MVQSRDHTHTHTHTHAHTHTRMHTHTHSHTRIRTHAQKKKPLHIQQSSRQAYLAIGLDALHEPNKNVMVNFPLVCKLAGEAGPPVIHDLEQVPGTIEGKKEKKKKKKKKKKKRMSLSKRSCTCTKKEITRQRAMSLAASHLLLLFVCRHGEE